MPLDQSRPYPTRPRLSSDIYKGIQRYSLTISTHGRYPTFKDGAVFSVVSGVLKKVACETDFRVWCYCFMPDHLHLLIEGKENASDLQQFIKLFKQKSGFLYKQSRGSFLWSTSYFDHVLRKEEDTEAVMRYILDNPVRAGIVRHWFEYPYSGSFEIDLEKWHQA